MIRYLSERIGTAALSVAGVIVIVFLVSHVLPGDAAAVRAGQYASPEQIARIRHQYGLDQPLLQQMASYVTGLLRGDFGTSIRTGNPIASDLFGRLPATLELSGFALLFALIIGVPLGVVSAARRGTGVDLFARIGTILASSTAIFWLGLMAIFILTNMLHLFPSPIGRLPRGVEAPSEITGSYVLDALLHGQFHLAATALHSIMLPALTLGVVTAAPVVKIVRAAMIRALRSDYVRTARAFGVPRRTIILHDAFRNSLMPILTSIGIVAGYLIGGNILIEQIFSWPGIGQYAYLSLQAHDLSAVQGFVIIVGLGYVLLNLLLDFAYMMVDPRVEMRSST